MQVDAVVLDIDGVLVDVADSYRRAIIESVERVCDKTIDRDAIQLFKDAGGFNNDWELTDAAALYVLARREGLGMDVETFTGRIAEGGGGLDAAKEVVGDLPESRRRGSATSGIPSDSARRFRRCTSARSCTASWRAAPPLSAPGYIHDEPTLVEPETIADLTDRFDVGVLTGGPPPRRRSPWSASASTCPKIGGSRWTTGRRGRIRGRW